MIITVFEDMCGSPCQEQDGAAYVFDPTGRLFDEVRLALAESTRPVVFVESREDLAQVYNELPEDEAVVSFSELRRFGDDVVGIDTSVATSPESGVSRSWLFRWTGSTWELADPVDVGVTVTTSVS
ncbi:MAG: hypothetical protein KJN81_12455 [Acidimicrobiia bacterium]|nr:hypothetical protein [Acidimicrobiia bacterium]NNL29233.1 hypothetical protein [Acidimicrobiia bacterium]